MRVIFLVGILICAGCNEKIRDDSVAILSDISKEITTQEPTVIPSVAPTEVPTNIPTPTNTPAPTLAPTNTPTPTATPSPTLTIAPTNTPTPTITTTPTPIMKYTAFTFEDGPTEYTPILLELLKKYNVKATFFVLGEQVEKYPEITKQIYADGHEIGIHGYDHTSFLDLREEGTVESINKTRKILADLGINDVSLIRPPHGQYVDQILKAIKDIGKEGGKDKTSYSIILHTADAGSDNLTAEQIKTNFTISCRLGRDETIILFRATTPERIYKIEPLINELIRFKFQFGTVTQLFENKNLKKEDGKIYTRVK